MAAKKATKSVSKKTSSKSTDKKSAKVVEKKAKPVKAPAAKSETKKSGSEKSPAKKVTLNNDSSLDSTAETPSTLVSAAEKEPAKKKRMTKKQLADQSEKNELTEKWAKLKDIDHDIKPQKYRMSEAYEPNTPLDHPVFGWGFILSLNENKLEVLFESGIKMLVSNLKL